MIKYLYIVSAAAFMSWVIFPTYLGIRYIDYSPTLQALLNISSIVFAIIGAWIAIIYPKAITQTFGKDEIKDGSFQNDTNYLAELVEIVLVSAFVLMFVLSVQFIVPLAKNYSQLINYRVPIKISFFFLITLMTFMQLHAIFRVIIANYHFLNELRIKNSNRAVDKIHNQ